MLKYARVAQMIYNSPWAILPEKLSAILEIAHLRISGGSLTDEEIQARIGAGSPRPNPRSSGAVAVLPLTGVIMHRANMFTDISGGTSTELFTAAFRQVLADPMIKAIVLDVDSPGGTVDGVEELASEIFQAREQKKVYAVANTLAASAAYWIASSATELIVTPSGRVGSIGTMLAHQDVSELSKSLGVKTTLVSAGKFKTEGNEFEPLSDAARAALQAYVDEFYGTFVKAVARNRGVSPSDVRNGYGEGRMVGAKQAVALGMADRVATLDETLARLGASRMPQTMSAAAELPPVVATPSPALARMRRECDPSFALPDRPA
jgi:signal peptide peptidase SppA